MAGTASLLSSPYFITNYILILVYPIFSIATNKDSRSLKVQDNFGFTYENSVIYTVLALAMMAYTRSTSNEQFFIDTLVACKIGVACLLLLVDIYYGIWYTLVCFLAWVVVPYPRLQSPNKFIKIRDEKHFEDLLKIKKGASK